MNVLKESCIEFSLVISHSNRCVSIIYDRGSIIWILLWLLWQYWVGEVSCPSFPSFLRISSNFLRLPSSKFEGSLLLYLLRSTVIVIDFDLPIPWFYLSVFLVGYLFLPNFFWGRCCLPCTFAAQRQDRSRHVWVGRCCFLVGLVSFACSSRSDWGFPRLSYVFLSSSSNQKVAFHVIRCGWPLSPLAQIWSSKSFSHQLSSTIISKAPKGSSYFPRHFKSLLALWWSEPLWFLLFWVLIRTSDFRFLFHISLFNFPSDRIWSLVS